MPTEIEIEIDALTEHLTNTMMDGFDTALEMLGKATESMVAELKRNDSEFDDDDVAKHKFVMDMLISHVIACKPMVRSKSQHMMKRWLHERFEKKDS